MRVIKPKKIFNGSEFIEDDYAVVLENGKIKDITKEHGTNAEECNGILTPGFINTHCHLELSYLKNKVEQKKGLVSFVSDVVKFRNTVSTNSILQHAEDADKVMSKNGIVAVGDISNTNITIPIKQNSNILYYTFIEIMGLNNIHAEAIFDKYLKLQKDFSDKKLLSTIVPHATYSLSNNLWLHLFEYLKKVNTINSIHFFESTEELKLLKGQSSAFEIFFQNIGLTQEDYNQVHSYIFKFLGNYLRKSQRTLLVHNTYLQEKDLELLSQFRDKLFFCLCPNANLYIESRLPNITLIQSFSDNICLGTDSLASNTRLSIVHEINTILRNFHDISIQDILKWGTVNGAKFLGIDNRFGFIKKGYSSKMNLITIENNQVELIKTFN